MTSDVEDDIERQDQEKEDSVTKSNKAASKAPKMDHTSKDLEDKGSKYFSMDSVHQKIEEEKKEKEKEDIEDLDLVSNET